MSKQISFPLTRFIINNIDIINKINQVSFRLEKPDCKDKSMGNLTVKYKNNDQELIKILKFDSNKDNLIFNDNIYWAVR